MLEVNYDASCAQYLGAGRDFARRRHHYLLASRAIGEQGIAAFLLGDIQSARRAETIVGTRQSWCPPPSLTRRRGVWIVRYVLAGSIQCSQFLCLFLLSFADLFKFRVQLVDDALQVFNGWHLGLQRLGEFAGKSVRRDANRFVNVFEGILHYGTIAALAEQKPDGGVIRSVRKMSSTADR